MNKIIALLLFVFLLSCNNKEKKQQVSFAPKVTEAKGYTVPKDSVSEPKTIPAGIPTTVKVGQPKVNPANLNVHIAGQPKIRLVGLPKINTPGIDIFLLPKQIATIGKTKSASIPEVVIAKDAAAKDINPANFSFYKTLQGLKHNTVRCMLQDKTGNLWFGTYGGGVCRYDGKSFTNFTEKEGLSNNFVWNILEDKTGNIWFGTNGGVCRYDGKSFTNFTEREGLSNNFVLSILEDKTGNLWFGTNGGGVCRYDGKSFTNFTEKEGLSNNVVYSILEDKTGNLWFGTYGGGVCSYDGKSFTNFTEKEGLTNNVVYSILEDKIGNIWFGTNGGGVCRYDGNRVEAIEKGDKIAKRTQQGLKKINGKLVKSFTNFTEKEGLSNNVVYSILEDKTGNLWFSTNGGGCRYDGNRVEAIEIGDEIAQRTQQDLKKINGKLVKSFTNFTEKEGLSNNVVYSVLEDKAGSLWFGTDGGVCRYDGKSFTNFTEREGLSNNFVYSILEDKTGNLWFGNDVGVCRYDGKSFANFTEKEGLSNNVVLSILEDKTGSLWFGTDGGGVCRYDGTFFTNFTEKEGLSNNVVYSILEDKIGNIWFGTYGGVSCYDGNRVEAIEKGNKIAQRTQQGLKKINGKLVKSFTNFTEKEGLSNNVVYSILEDKTGNLWFATNGGVSRYDGNRVEAIEQGNKIAQRTQEDLKKTNGKFVKSFTNFTEKEGLSNNFIYSILEDKTGNLWFGTNGGGVCCYDGKSFTNFTEKEGLSNNAVLNMIQDVDGNIWFGTRKGLSKVTPTHLAKFTLKGVEMITNLNPIKEAFFYNYGYNDGFLGFNCRRNSVLEDSKGRIWWGANVLTCYDPKGNVADTTAPVVNLTSVKLFGEEIAWANLNAVYTDSTGKEIINGITNDTLLSNGILLKNIRFDGLTKWFSLPEHLSLSYNNNNLTFNFIGVHMQSRNHIKYQYKLEGIDPDWSSITNRTEAPYGNLPSGDYVFKIKAMNQSGHWSKPYEFKFVVCPPWWQTWWFRTLMGALIISIVVSYVKWRERVLKFQKEILEQTVIERTSEVVEEKKIVEVQKQLIEEKHKEITDSVNYAERIQKNFLVTNDFLNTHLKTGFIVFKPKDKVSGDFYWAEKLNNNNIAVTVADSTGHGIPGAFMSLLNMSLLNEAVLSKHYSNTADILDFVRRKLILGIKPNEKGEGGNDGMDACLFVINYRTLELQFTGANNSLWIIRNHELIELKGEKMPVGRSVKQDIPFTSQYVQLQPGDWLYASTDGYVDQFGGEKNKKFMSKQLKETLLQIQHLNENEQKQQLETIFDNWKGTNEQVDDVCVVGIRI